MGKRKKVAVIGAGAAGYFAAISVKQHHPATEVILFEKSLNCKSGYNSLIFFLFFNE